MKSIIKIIDITDDAMEEVRIESDTSKSTHLLMVVGLANVLSSNGYIYVGSETTNE